jgi:hypothetical protein
MGLFSSGTKKTSSTLDPYANMPDWQKQYYQDDTGRASDIIDRSKKIGKGLAENPRTLSDLSGKEVRANRNVQQGVKQAGKTVGQGIDAVRGANRRADRMMDRADDGIGKANRQANRELDRAGNYNQDWNRYEKTLQGAGDFDAIRESYENPWTDNVVGTTLDSMRHQAAVEQAKRAASESAVGGIGSTRMGVADATAEALNGMNMAQIEAMLRSEGFNTAADLGLRQSAEMRQQAQLGFTEQDMESRLGMDLADSRFGLQEDYSRLMSDLAAAGYDLSSDYFDDMLSGSKAQLGIAETGATWLANTGAEQRGIDDANAEAKRLAESEGLTWEANVFNGTRNIQAPVGGTTTNTQPTPSTFQQILGAGATVAGALV